MIHDVRTGVGVPGVGVQLEWEALLSGDLAVVATAVRCAVLEGLAALAARHARGRHRGMKTSRHRRAARTPKAGGGGRAHGPHTAVHFMAHGFSLRGADAGGWAGVERF